MKKKLHPGNGAGQVTAHAATTTLYSKLTNISTNYLAFKTLNNGVE